MIHGAQLGMASAPIKNYGTISFIGAGDGTYIVKAANGSPISIQAGRVTINPTTGEFVSVEFLSVDGPHGEPADSRYDTFVPALT
jgi:hypothetical protein